MPTHQLSLLDLPSVLLQHTLSFVESDQPPDLASALLSCKGLRLAGEGVPLTKARPVIMLREAEAAGRDEQLLAFLARKAKVWRQVLLVLEEPDEELPLLLHSLAPHGRCSGLRELELSFVTVPALVPKELGWLTNLKRLTVFRVCSDEAEPTPAVGYSNLAQLPGLQELHVCDMIAGQFLPVAFSLQRLTSLTLDLQPVPLPAVPADAEPTPRLSAAHLAACTALQKLWLRNVNVFLSPQEALAAWQQLQHLALFSDEMWQVAGFWTALPCMPMLTRLEVGDTNGEALEMLQDQLPAWSRLASLDLRFYPEPALPQLPTSLTELTLRCADRLQAVPVAPSLCSLLLSDCLALDIWPAGLTAMSRLTALHILACGLGAVPAPVAALPALEELQLYDCDLGRLPGSLAFLGSLRKLDLRMCGLEFVPLVLGSGLASRLQHLDLSENGVLVVNEEGLQILCSLTTLQYLGMRDMGPGRWQDWQALKDKISPLLPACNIDIGRKK